MDSGAVIEANNLDKIMKEGWFVLLRVRECSDEKDQDMSEEVSAKRRPSQDADDEASEPVDQTDNQANVAPEPASPAPEPEPDEECQRCEETKRVYKIECSHKICKTCLPEKTDICDSMSPDLCPLCQKEVLFKEEPPQARPPPLRRFSRVREVHDALHPSQCDACESQTKEIICRCIDCKVYLCEGCAKPSVHNKDDSRHRIFTLEELKTGGEFSDVAVITKCDMTYCQVHGSKLAQWCRSCDKGLCDVCHREHKDHLTTTMSQRITEMAMFVEEEKRRIEVASVALGLAETEFKKDKDKTAEDFQNMAAKIQEVAIARKARIDQDMEKLLAEVNDTLKTYDEKNHEVNDEMDREEANLATFRRVFEIMEEDSQDGKLGDDKIMRLYTFLHANKELADREMLHVPKVLDSMRTQAGKKWRFDESRFLFMDNINTVGTISDRSDPPPLKEEKRSRDYEKPRDLDLLSPSTYTVDASRSPRSGVNRFSPTRSPTRLTPTLGSPVHQRTSPVPPISLNRLSARDPVEPSSRSNRGTRSHRDAAGRLGKNPRAVGGSPVIDPSTYRSVTSPQYTMKKSGSLNRLDQIPSSNQPSMFMKVLLLGDQVVGKTRLLGKLIRDDASEKDPKPTLGLDCGARKIIVGDETIMMTIWDISGKESYRSSLQIYSKETQIIILVYDVARRNSFESLEAWLDEATKHAPKDVQVIVVGNTELLRDHPEWIRKRRVETIEAEEWATARACYFTELSVRASSKKIDDKFRQIFCDMLRRRRPAQYSTKTLDRLARGYQVATRKDSYCNVQ